MVKRSLPEINDGPFRHILGESLLIQLLHELPTGVSPAQGAAVASPAPGCHLINIFWQTSGEMHCDTKLLLNYKY